jgi:hypothetical protein
MTLTKRFLSLFVVLLTAFYYVLSTTRVEALPPTGDWLICVSMGWESDCGEYNLYGDGSEVVNRVIGGPDLSDGLWDCAVLGANGCRAVKTRTIAPQYVTETTAATTSSTSSTSSTTTIAGGSSTSSTTTIAGGSSTSSTTTIAGGSSTSSTTTVAPSSGSLARCLTAVCGYAVVDDQNYVYGVIVCSDACTGTRMTQSYMGCPAGCRLILQAQQTSDGNVAGWHGQDVKYNEGSQTFSLPSGGTIKSGDKLEEAVFPTTTTTSTTGPTATVPANNSASVIKDIAAPSGVVYESAAKYVAAETETVMSAKSIEIKLPVIPVRELNYEVSFDPAGPARKVVIETGKIIDNLVIKNENKKVFKKLSILAVSSVESSTISVDQKMLKNRNGLVSVTLGSSVAKYAQVNIKVTSAKKYSNCKELNKDYPGGVMVTNKWIDVKTSKQKVNYVAKPVMNVPVYYLNQKMDLDKDKIVCETNN